ncbi:hypothetical protein ABW19_dt0201617 [Dactylella cylindrospora]|nr:hypothetical protein ABW19_dt0201617 [Dactylella cylindrospora]
MSSTHSEQWLQNLQNESSWVCPIGHENDSAYVFSTWDELSHHILLHHPKVGEIKEETKNRAKRDGNGASHLASSCPLCLFRLEADPPQDDKSDDAIFHTEASQGEKRLGPHRQSQKRVKLSSDTVSWAMGSHIAEHMHHLMIMSLQLMSAMSGASYGEGDLQSVSGALSSHTSAPSHDWLKDKLDDLPSDAQGSITWSDVGENPFVESPEAALGAAAESSSQGRRGEHSFDLDSFLSSEKASGVVVFELPEFLIQERSSILEKFKLLDARQRDRIVDGVKNGANSPFSIDQPDHIVSRNRYANIHVWDSTRVKLGIDAADNDYINASHISLGNPTGLVQRYIATQGPKEDQARHLWLMVLEQTARPGVVVMLTKTFEMGRDKCYQYFPVDMEDPHRRFDRSEYEPSATDPFNFEINLLECTYDEEARTEIRKIEITVLEGTHMAEPDAESFVKELKAGDTKIVWHLLFGGWPDWGIPEGEDSEALMKLIDLANSKNEVANSPLIVHCSAGVGRTGTFIALDHLLTEIERGTYDSALGDPIFDLVDRLREQRMYMVQSEPQYEYLYRVVRERLGAKLGIPLGSNPLSISPALTQVE